MTKDELKNIFAALRAVYPHWQISAQLFEVWFLVIGKWQYSVAHDAVKVWLSQPSTFPPTCGQINVLCEARALPSVLRMSPEEALEHTEEMLTQDARDFADRATPCNRHTQYSSIEELHKATAIRKAQWKKVFVQRFEKQKEEAMALVRVGWEPQEAIKKVVALPLAVEQLQQPVQAALGVAIGGT